MKMNHFLKEQPSPDTSNNVSSSGLSREDQEMGSTAMSRTVRDSFMRRFSCHCFPLGMDLNPARMILAEMVGTFILVFCVCGIIASTQLTRGEVGIMEYAATAGLTVVVVIFSIGPISGAHVNPAVTIAFAIFGHFQWSKVPFYVMAQTVGSVLATWVGTSIYGIKSGLMATRPLHGCISAFWVEFIATFIIMFLTASLSHEHQSVGHLSGFVVGIAIGLAVLITGPVSGGSMNPARSLGPAILSWDFNDIWIYVTGPVIGAFAGALMYHLLRLQRRPCTAPSSPNSGLLHHSLQFPAS